MRYFALVGRPNVGKSTLFNRIVGGRPAIVDDTPGVTRDRNVGTAEWFGRTIAVIDSGGFEPDSKDIILSQMREQTLMAVEEADVILFVVDGREGITPVDEEIARILRKSEKPVRLIVNKVDTPGQAHLAADFSRLGFDHVRPVSAEHAQGVDDLLEEELADLPLDPEVDEDADPTGPIRIAVVGKPNVGKSSLVNWFLGSSRMMVSDIAGTTRDSVDTHLMRDGVEYVLIDTAGIRRKSKVSDKLEKYSVIMALKAIQKCDIALLLVDAVDGVSTQEAKIAGMVEEAGKGMIILVNKWDAVEDKETDTHLAYEEAIHRQIKFMPYAPVVFISALTGQRVEKVFDAVNRVYEQFTSRITTSRLNDMTERLTTGNEPPCIGGNGSPYFAMRLSTSPPAFVFMCNYPEGIHFSYRRFLVNRMRELTGLAETPIHLKFRKPAGRRSGERDER